MSFSSHDDRLIYSGFFIRFLLQIGVYYQARLHPLTRIATILLLDAVDTLPYWLSHDAQQTPIGQSWTYASTDKLNDVVGYILIHQIVHDELDFPRWQIDALTAALLLRGTGLLAGEALRDNRFYAYCPDLYREYVILFCFQAYYAHWPTNTLSIILVGVTLLKIRFEFQKHGTRLPIL